MKQLGHCEAEQKKLKLPLDPMFLSSSLSLNLCSLVEILVSQ